MYDSATPYIASFVLVRKAGKIAFVMRSNTQWMNGFYGLPSGKVEKEESFSAAALREVKEEIGVTVLPDQLRYIHTTQRHEPGSFATDWIDVFFEAEQWSGEPHNAEPHMHSELAWLDPNNLPENVIPAVKFSLEQIEAGKLYSEYGFGKLTF